MEIYGDVNVFGDNSQIHLNYDLSESKSYSGFICYDRVEVGIEYGTVLYLDLSKRIWTKACGNSINTIPARGVACATSESLLENIPILLMGFMYIDIYQDTIKQSQLWVSDVNPGIITDVMPTIVGNYAQTIGFAKSKNVFYFDFCPFYIQIG